MQAGKGEAAAWLYLCLGAHTDKPLRVCHDTSPERGIIWSVMCYEASYWIYNVLIRKNYSRRWMQGLLKSTHFIVCLKPINVSRHGDDMEENINAKYPLVTEGKNPAQYIKMMSQ